jgi:hypothetical protein
MTISRGGIHAAEKKGREKMVLVGFVSSQKKKLWCVTLQMSSYFMICCLLETVCRSCCFCLPTKFEISGCKETIAVYFLLIFCSRL